MKDLDNKIHDCLYFITSNDPDSIVGIDTAVERIRNLFVQSQIDMLEKVYKSSYYIDCSGIEISIIDPDTVLTRITSLEQQLNTVK